MCQRCGLPYITGTLTSQTTKVWERILLLALPGGGTPPAVTLETTTGAAENPGGFAAARERMLARNRSQRVSAAQH